MIICSISDECCLPESPCSIGQVSFDLWFVLHCISILILEDCVPICLKPGSPGRLRWTWPLCCWTPLRGWQLWRRPNRGGFYSQNFKHFISLPKWNIHPTGEADCCKEKSCVLGDPWKTRPDWDCCRSHNEHLILNPFPCEIFCHRVHFHFSPLTLSWCKSQHNSWIKNWCWS